MPSFMNLNNNNKANCLSQLHSTSRRMHTEKQKERVILLSKLCKIFRHAWWLIQNMNICFYRYIDTILYKYGSLLRMACRH